MKFSAPRLSTFVGAALLAISGSSFAAGATLGQVPPSSLIVSAGGYEWVYANPCAGESPSCGVVQLSNGFQFATDSQWNASFASIGALVSAFTDDGGNAKCASPYFSVDYNHCDFNDAKAGYIWHSPLAPDAFHRDDAFGETFLVRGAVNAVPEPSEYALMLLGLATIAGVMRRRKV